MSPFSGELHSQSKIVQDSLSSSENYVSMLFDTIPDSKIVRMDWMNENIDGSPTICEAYGTSYTSYNLVSSYTGLPTVFGWQTHEWLWRFHGIVNQETDLLESDPEKDVWKLYITPRHNDVDVVYLSSYAPDVQSIINKYQIEYIVIGDLERHRYGYDNSAVFAELGNVVFQYEDLTVYKVIPVTV